MAPRQESVVSGYRYQWALYTDWCAAADVEPLPASPITLAEFLDDNPAGDTVQLRRVSAINRAHLDAGHPAPGRVTSLRIALGSARAARTARHAAQCQAIAAALPTSGSTAALFGRRDAVLLLLAGAGLSYTAIAALDRNDITTDGDSVFICGTHRITLHANISTSISVSQVWQRWDQVLTFSGRYPSTRVLATHLETGRFPDMTGWPARDCPVAVPIDRWGHLPLPSAAMTPAAIAAIINSHLTGRAALHTVVDRRVPTEGPFDALPVPACPSPDLDTRYYAAGVAARRAAHTALADIPTVYDDVEDRAEQLLQRTLDLLEHF